MPMSNSKKKKLTPVQQEYQGIQKQNEIKRPVVKNCIKAFLTGGLICLIGQVIQTFYITYFDFTDKTAGNPTVGTLVFIAMLLTGFGNAVISAAIEHRTEGFVLGVGGNMFKLAGPVIVFGVFSAFVIALIKTILIQWGGL